MPRTVKRRPTLSGVTVRRRLGDASCGWLFAGGLALPCKLGPRGLTRTKREGDGGTPVGRFALLRTLYRADRQSRPGTRLPCRATRPDDGWCDDPRTVNYNRPVCLPTKVGHEVMWRPDGLYDLVVVIDYNASRPRRGRGSAIFLHAMHPEGRPTAGCVALRAADLRRLLPRLAAPCRISIG